MALKTYSEANKKKRRDAWDQRLSVTNGVVPGGKKKASWWSVLMFSWIAPLVNLAYARPLEPENLFPLPLASRTLGLLSRFEQAWGEQLAKPKGKRSLVWALYKVFRKKLFFSGILALVQQISLLAIPLIVQRLLNWFIEEQEEAYVGIIWAVALFVVGFCGNGLLSNHYFLTLYILGMDARSTLNGVTYAKSLRLSNKARQSTSTGELVTLMSNDAQRLPDMSLSVHAIWSTPLFIFIAIFFLIRLVGAAALAGVIFMVGIIPIQGFLAAKQMGFQREQMKQTGARVKVINEVLQGIRIVKYYAWEVPFMERIDSMRNREVSTIKKFAFLNAYSMSMMLTTPFVMVMLTFIVYSNGNGNFSPDVIFTAVSLLLVIRLPLMMLPMAIAGWVQGKISIGRMQKFFELEELQASDRQWTNRSGNGKGAGALSISGLFVWTPEIEEEEENDNPSTKKGVEEKEENDNPSTKKGVEEKEAMVVSGGKEGDMKKKSKMSAVSAVEERAEVIQNESSEDSGTDADGASEIEAWDLQIDGLEVPEGKFVAVVGQVGSGKSSFVSALLGEMTRVTGGVSIDGSVAYVAQSAWIINASLRDNIIMGRPFDQKFYDRVLEVCEMQQDLAQLPAGDMTEIGEKGINLSGGQKQRVSIARAAYADADVYILDDPLSAVDAHVGRHLFDECLVGLLKGKTRILCTNQLQFLSQTDVVLVVHEGRIVEEGSYAELVAVDGGGLARLMKTFAESDSDEDDDDDDDDDLGGTNNEGHQERKEAEAPIVPFTHPAKSGLPPLARGGKRPIVRKLSDISVDAWARSAREVSDVTSVIVEGLTGSSPAPSSSTVVTTGLSARIDAFASDDNTLEAEVTGVTRRRNRTGSRNSFASQGVGSFNMNRQNSDGGRKSRASVGPRPSKSASAEGQEALTAGRTLKTVEGREEGAVALRVFKIYFRDGSGSWVLPIMLIIVSILTQAFTNVFDIWLSFWSDRYLEESEPEVWYQYIYAALCMTVVALYLIRALLFAWQAVLSSKHLHAVLSHGVMRAPVSFFDTTPIGRVLNRFTKDMDSIDLLLPRNVPQFVATLSVLVGVMITIVAVLPWFVIVIIPVMYAYYRVQMYFRPVNRDLQRLESVSRSPIFAQFSETLNGVATLRAYNQQEEFIARNNERLDDSSRAFYHMHVSNRWLGVRLEAMGTIMNLAAALLIVLSKYTDALSIKAGIAGLVLTYTQQVTGYLNWTVRMGCETEARITAVERAQEYADLTPEAPPVVDDYRPPKGWPGTGALKFEGIKMRYRAGLDLVLKGVTIDVKGGERIGIAGRTGSGKSSLMVALFRIVEPCDGSLTIDGVDALRLGLKDLREAISIIPQDPVMFVGTMRNNLDPFGRYDDVTIWASLEAARLAPFVSGLEGKLDAEVSEGGENMSLGQRQLVCLARAVLRRNKILVLDEATANVDVDTDSLIQEAIRLEFKNCTVLTIAHRLNTIMDSDRILVMQDGKVGEIDTPANLVANQRSLLMGFIRQTGSGPSRRLVNLATNHDGSSSTASAHSSSPEASPARAICGSPQTASALLTDIRSPTVSEPQKALTIGDAIHNFDDSGEDRDETESSLSVESAKPTE